MLKIDEPLRTERLVLRPFADGDLDALHAIHSREDVTRYLYLEPRDRVECAEALEKRVAGTSITEPGQALAIAVVLAETGEVIGDLYFEWLSEEHRRAEIGFVFHPDHYGRGYATEAARELLRLGFDCLGLHRVIGRCDARNIASATVLGKLGLREEARLRENEFVKGEWVDELVFAILDREWRARQP
ncbi:GNAT family N-acetyltransferase [Amycolatopsis sp. CA-230715]|uniref:GNAT family N-acetyltransferase n=1 Tax=Amycolatopsis sp. CA-230715 TaxID=2745196 RepID=UPI001C028D03|nr:GNAT family protein [Amycolatopsis sp. CA-230715]